MTTLNPVDDHRLGDDGVDLFALMCQRRGWSEDFLRRIDDPSHDELLSLDEMVEALEDARVGGKKITIAPDFDMDGISSGVLGYAGLAELGFDVEMHVPDYRRGHDLTPEDIEEIRHRYPSTQVLLTCDGGVNSHRGIAAARALGWTTLVTDHHQELEPGSTADITVNPCRIDETYAHPGICGAHVLYQVIEAYTRTYQPTKFWQIRLLRLFAGLGTVSDVMPVLYENRQLVRDSLSIARLLLVTAPKIIPNQYGGFDPDPDVIDIETSTLMQVLRTEHHHPVFLSAFQGFALALKAFAQAGKINDVDSMNEGFYGFYLAPAMNSPRRTGAPLDDCFTVFTGVDVDEKLAAMTRVIENNELRKELTITNMEELVEGDQPLAPWVYFSSAYPGMYGLLASKLMERNGHPVAVVNRPEAPGDFVSGSGRAPAWFDIISTLDPHPGLRGVGHEQACGVKVERAELLDDLVQVLVEGTEVARLTLDGMSNRADLVLGPDDDSDANLDDLEPLFDFVRRVESLSPFGHGFTQPVVEIGLEPLGLRLKRIGSEGQHIRLVTRSGLSCLWWNTAQEHYDDLTRLVEQAECIDVPTLRFTAQLQLNTFRGETRVQAVIGDKLHS